MPTNQPEMSQSTPVAVSIPSQIIYADKIINVGIGISVSRLTLAMEVGANTVAPFAQLIIPTPSLFETLEFMANNVTNNDAIKKGVIEALDNFKEKFLTLAK